ncbi:MAG: 4Fe-4S dicluster domain-containing protein [Candidatus Hydrogenedentes bacterium]|nr:4Fe-4S dicluster domain-containing protein [Candidatus Hydrogenedentota bacterium]
MKALGAGVAGAMLPFEAHATDAPSALPSGCGMLVDTTECIGCRKCEFACAGANHLSDKPLEAFEDTKVFDAKRRMTADAYTVVNRYADATHPDKPTFIKVNCMHCLQPACASACIVGALRKQDNGAVTYDAGKCLGCRYCMIACPFQVPAYEYNNALTPVVSKCSFCYARVTAENKPPACVEICPPDALMFGERTKLLQLAHDKIASDPERYLPHVYGETELGGTSWLYLAGRPFEDLGFREFPAKPVPELTETIQHNVFKFGIPPVLLYGLLCTAMKTFDAGPASPKPDLPPSEE